MPWAGRARAAGPPSQCTAARTSGSSTASMTRSCRCSTASDGRGSLAASLITRTRACHPAPDKPRGGWFCLGVILLYFKIVKFSFNCRIFRQVNFDVLYWKVWQRGWFKWSRTEWKEARQSGARQEWLHVDRQGDRAHQRWGWRIRWQLLPPPTQEFLFRGSPAVSAWCRGSSSDAHGGGKPHSFDVAWIPRAPTPRAQADGRSWYPVPRLLPRSDQAGDVPLPRHPDLAPQCPHHATQYARPAPAPEGGESIIDNE